MGTIGTLLLRPWWTPWAYFKDTLGVHGPPIKEKNVSIMKNIIPECVTSFVDESNVYKKGEGGLTSVKILSTVPIA